nr:MAG TPA: hypothetical protein [Bacteriophage sp.]DAL19462.1 MAG TPA_asm: hypothetical protein [Caudoviricetes sp.]DAP60831.1 MAG TPA: hypothetical protein [Caudoviricetes sp.]DAQ45181.1 MAG TPA: hypothetical protein [Caudoviricetes sp.]DAZ53021.1 MAG TPA: hypothetical protein [Caudoviricetes sp.]
MILRNLRDCRTGYKPKPVVFLGYIQNKASLNEDYAVIEIIAKQFQQTLLTQG